MVDLADGLGVARRPKARDLVEGQIRPGGDDEVVVVDGRTIVELDTVLRRMNTLGALGPQGDPALGKDRREIRTVPIAIIIPNGT